MNLPDDAAMRKPGTREAAEDDARQEPQVECRATLPGESRRVHAERR